VTVTTGQQFDIIADFENRTTTNVGHGGITISLPGFDGTANNYSWYSYEGDTNGTRTVDYKYPGETVYRRNPPGGSTTATAFMIEGDDTEWIANHIVPPYDEDNILRLGVTASSTPETFYVYVRAWLSDSDWNEREILPTSSSYTDQQSYPVYRYIVNVTAPPPPGTPGTPDLDSADDTGYRNWDNITFQTSNLTFSWEEATGATHYYYEWDDDTPNDGPITGTSVSVNAPSGNGLHTFFVRGWNSEGGYGSSSSIDVYIDRNRPSITNVDLRDTDDTGQYNNDNLTNDTNVRFTWTGNTNGGSGIYRYWYGWSSSADDASTTNNYADVSPPSNNSLYTFYVGAEAVSGLWAYYPDYTDQETVTWDTTAPSSPQPYSPSGDIFTLTPDIEWTYNSSTDWKYDVDLEYDTGSDVSGWPKTATRTGSIPASNLVWNENYRVRVREYDIAGNPGSYSDYTYFSPIRQVTSIA